jgi:hypothetical protein
MTRSVPGSARAPAQTVSDAASSSLVMWFMGSLEGVDETD